MKATLPGVWPWKLAALVVVLLCFVAIGCPPSPTPEPPPPPGSWLVLLCKASDNAAEPHPPQFYKDLFSKTAPDLLFNYFDMASNHTVDLSGTEVFGWFSMMVNTDTISPAKRNNTTAVTRTQTARDCRASALGGIAATGKSVDPANFAGVITVINVPVDSGDAGEKSVVVFQPESSIGFVTHEMLHVYRLGHSWLASSDASSDHTWGHGGDTEYQDCWDVMSFQTCVFTFDTASNGVQATMLQGAYRQKLKWLPADHVKDVPLVPTSSTVKLVPVSADLATPGIAMATVEAPGRGYYTVEFRDQSGFDRGIPRPAVVIRELRTNGRTYLVQRQGGRIDWVQGDLFTDSTNYLSIKVDSIVPGSSATVTFNTAFSAAPASAGGMCGDKYHGQVNACPTGTACGPKRGNQIQTIDWFCL